MANTAPENNWNDFNEITEFDGPFADPTAYKAAEVAKAVKLPFDLDAINNTTVCGLFLAAGHAEQRSAKTGIINNNALATMLRVKTAMILYFENASSQGESYYGLILSLLRRQLDEAKGFARSRDWTEADIAAAKLSQS